MRDLRCPNAGVRQPYVVSSESRVMSSNPLLMAHVLRIYEFDRRTLCRRAVANRMLQQPPGRRLASVVAGHAVALGIRRALTQTLKEKKHLCGRNFKTGWQGSAL